MSRIIALASIPVKPTRVGPRKSTRFGAGLLASRPAYRAPYTAADEAWLIAASTAGPDYDAMAAESAAMDRLEAGLFA